MMYKKLLTLISLVASIAANAQSESPSITPADSDKPITQFEVTYADRLYETQIWKSDDFNVGEKNTEILKVWGDCSPEVAENPDKTGVHTGDKCLKLTVGEDGNDLFKMELPKNQSDQNRFNLFGRRRLSLLFKPKEGANNFNVKLELHKNNSTAEENFELKLGAWYDAGGGWKRMFFNFEPYEVADDSHQTISDTPNILVFKASMDESVSFNKDDIFYLDDIKVEDEPYADGIWIDSFGNKHDRWETTYDSETAHQEFPHDGNNGVIYLSGTWLKGENIVNPDLSEDQENPKGGRWTYVYNEYRDLSWHIKSDKSQITYFVFHKDSKLRLPDRGALLGTGEGDAYDYSTLAIKNKNILVFAEDCGGYDDSWYTTNVVTLNNGAWEAKELEMCDDYPFVNPTEFTSKEKIMVTRHMYKGFNTIIYPFSLQSAEICSSRVGTFYHHNDDNTVYFVPTDHTEPNVPFVTEGFTPTFIEGETNVTDVFQQFEGERQVSAVDPSTEYSSKPAKGNIDYYNSQMDDAGYKFVGTYKRISGEGKWGIATSGDKQSLKKGSSTSSFKPYRAYLDIGDTDAPSRFSTLQIGNYEELLNSVSTNAGEIPINPHSGTADVYSPSGVRLIPAATPANICRLPRGIYILNGRKIFVK